MDEMGIIIPISQKQKVRFNDFHNLQRKIHGVLFIAVKQEGTAVTSIDYLDNLGIPVLV